MGEKQSIKETKEAVIAAAKFFKLGKEVMADGKIGISDIGSVISAGPGILTATMAAAEGAKNIPAEFKDLSIEEASELTSAIMSEFSVDDEKAQKIISGAFKIIAGGAEIAGAF